MDEYQSIIKVLKDALNTTDISYNHLCIEIALELLNTISQVDNQHQNSVQSQQETSEDQK